MPSLQSSEAASPLISNIRENENLSNGPKAALSMGFPDGESRDGVPMTEVVNGTSNGSNAGFFGSGIVKEEAMQLELKDGTKYQGTSFGAKKSIAGELVFQTGMVGYPESITDPSYKGQILIITFPLVGNYGVPSRETMDDVVSELPAYFEATQIHISGLVVASYSGEDYSHHLATSSLGTWLKQQGVPAMCGVDTRALTKRIREKGSMLGKMMLEVKQCKSMVNGRTAYKDPTYQLTFETIDWFDPNTKNLVADGELILHINSALRLALTTFASLCARASSVLSISENRSLPSFWASHQSRLR